jgi:C-terminal processing protease CtpA/Prc
MQGAPALIGYIDASPHRGKLLRLTARILEGIDNPARLSLTLAATKNGSTQIEKALALSTDGSAASSQLTYLYVRPDSTQLALRIGQQGHANGTIELSIDAADSASEVMKLDPKIEGYLGQALTLLKEGSVYRSQADWAQIEDHARKDALGARSNEELYPAISAVLRSLGDFHGRLIDPRNVAQARAFPATLTPDGAGFEFSPRMLGNHVAYVSVPPSSPTDAEMANVYSERLQSALQALDRDNPCGWIVDLRRNGGGGMHPMILGLSGLLRDDSEEAVNARGQWLLGIGLFPDGDVIGSFVDQTGTSIAEWELTDQMFFPPFPGHYLRNPGKLDHGSGPVAVLIGPNTASAGEAVAIAFSGRDRTRFFGQPSSGYITAVQSHELPDGAWLAFSATFMADRNGKVFRTAIIPDELVAFDEDVAQHPILAAAHAWLAKQTECRNEHAAR